MPPVQTIGIITCSQIPDLIEEEQPLISKFEQEGFQVSIVIWDDPYVTWDEYDLLIIRSIWDYHLKYDLFLKWLDVLESAKTVILNPIQVIRWNSHKNYLHKLESEGILIIPTHINISNIPFDIAEIKNRNWNKVVIKPAISASAHMTYLVDIRDEHIIKEHVSEIGKSSDVLIQPFISKIKTHGELSIIFFNKTYAYTILKQAVNDPFRVQNDYGGTSKRVFISESQIDQVRPIFDLIPNPILYARIDGIFIDDQFKLMELELIEPSLFLNECPGAHDRFVEATLDIIK